MQKGKIYDDLLAGIEADRQELVDLCLKLGNTPSFHGRVSAPSGPSIEGLQRTMRSWVRLRASASSRRNAAPRGSKCA